MSALFIEQISNSVPAIPILYVFDLFFTVPTYIIYTQQFNSKSVSLDHKIFKCFFFNISALCRNFFILYINYVIE